MTKIIHCHCPKCHVSMAQIVVSTPVDDGTSTGYPYVDKAVWWCPECRTIRGETDVVVGSRMLNRVASQAIEMRGDNQNE